MSINALMLDFGRVLADFDHEFAAASIAARAHCTKRAVLEMVFASSLMSDHETGKISSSEFYLNVCEACGIPPELMRENEFKQMWGNIFSDNPGVRKVLAKLRPNVPIVLVSNTDPIHWEVIEKLPVVHEQFSEDQQILSFRIGAKKPDRRMFDAALSALGSSPETTLYIDDIQQYLDAFAELGGTTAHYDCSQQGAGQLERILQSYSLLA